MMTMSNHGLRVRSTQSERGPVLELHLSRRTFARGRSLSGVVVLRLARSTDIRSLTVSVEGWETVTRGLGSGKVRRPGLFFKRESLLSGRDSPRFIAERLSQYWNAFLKREKFRCLSAGEHIYPFTLPLPGSLPPTCEAGPGKVSYRITARLRPPLGAAFQLSSDIVVVFGSECAPPEQFSLSHSSVYGGKHATGADITVALNSRCFAAGSPVMGRLILSNPRKLPMGRVTLALLCFEGLRDLERVGSRSVVAMLELVADSPVGEQSSMDFCLDIPAGVPPTVEGKALKVAWSLEVVVEASPPLELSVPVIVSQSAN